MSEQIFESLKKKGLRNTRHRTEILKVLSEAEYPLTIDGIYLELVNNNISINPSTVYRTLETLVSNNLVLKLKISGDNRSFYELDQHLHKHYIVCLDCKKMQAIEHCPLDEYEKKISKKTNFQIKGHRLNIYGYCADCKDNNSSDS